MKRLALILLFPLLLVSCGSKEPEETRFRNVACRFDYENAVYQCAYYKDEKLVKDWKISLNHTYYSKEKPYYNYTIIVNEVVESPAETYLVLYSWVN